MKCEVRNVQSSEVFQIPPEGMVFGRAGGPANITVSDQSVSKRHARIYLKEGTWVLEDLKSVNGTVVNNRRITEPVPVAPGIIFQLSKHQFEIVSADGQQSAMSARSSSGKNGAPMAAEGAMGSDPRRSRSSQRPQRPSQPVADDEPLLPPEPSQRRQSPPADEPADMGGGAEQDAYLDEAAQGGAGAVLAALPKAIAYYLAAIPLMALNPLGTVRKGVEDPKLKAMGPLELIAFILPVQLFANLAGAWAAAIGTLLGGGGFQVMLFFPIVQLIVAVVVSVISGFITHPVLRFIIDRLFKGESDDTTRTNYMIMTQTAAALIAIPTAMALLLTPVIARLSASFGPASLLLIVPALLTAVVTPLPVLIAWMWMKAFRVLPIIQKILFVLLILSILGGVARAAGGVVDAIRGVGGGGGGSAVVVDPNDAEAVKKALEDAAKNVEDAAKNGDDDKKADDDDKKADDDDKKADDDKKVEAVVKTDDDKKVDDKKVEAVAKSDDPPSRGGYPAYKEKRDFIEQTIANDPSLLRDSRIGNLYKELSRETYIGIAQAEEEVLGRKKRYDPALKLYLDRYKEMKIYDQSKKTVDQLHKLLQK